MRPFYTGLFCLLWIAVCTQGSIDQTTGQVQVQLRGSWVNELGSLLVVDSVDAEGKIHGQYQSSTGVDGKVFPLLGWVNRGTDEDGILSVAFTVRWEGYGSITSWTGYLDTDADGHYIKTLWHLVRPGTQYPWERIIANSSVFRPVEREE
jgi:hypothetical protein